ncbi:hypothetical protein PX860_25505 (plasmid) [Agrobacterium leguminum]|uniref:hypothetical protein n=1 Tax=Agrobacterium leguminum TaxID=2792015 RepID=UPI00272D6473|nr:hypothetical protein [Agrobacterium leguminum]WLE00666.1 hypothetical protein PX860_25505 [Agrobacterium leguminum]
MSTKLRAIHPYERLASFYDRVGGRNKPFAIDHRDIVFAKSNHGQDGGQHDIPEGVELTASLLQRTLESRFRFGTPLRPDGFQHDAQLERGARFVRTQFDCAVKGMTTISGDHANVFPSDVVT